MRMLYLSRRSCYWAIIAAALVLVLAVAAALAGARVRASGEAKLLPVYKVATDRAAIAISFDASWGAERTEDILNILDEYGIKTTFFLVNIWVEDYPDLAREIKKRGHEIGLHSVTHPHFTQLDNEQVRRELEDNYRLIQETTGAQPCLFRPPFGDYNSRVIEQVASCGYQAVQWSVDTLHRKKVIRTNGLEQTYQGLCQNSELLS